MGKDHRKWPGVSAPEIASPIAAIVVFFPRRSQNSEKEIQLVKNPCVSNLTQELRAIRRGVYFLMKGGMPISYK